MLVRFLTGYHAGRSLEVRPVDGLRLLELGEAVRVISLEPGAPELDENGDLVHFGPQRQAQPTPAPAPKAEPVRQQLREMFAPRKRR